MRRSESFPYQRGETGKFNDCCTDHHKAAMFPVPKPEAPCLSMSSMKNVFLSNIGLVKICFKYRLKQKILKYASEKLIKKTSALNTAKIIQFISTHFKI
jgi:hypothetical protein